MCPIQLRMNNLFVNECSSVLSPIKNIDNNSIYNVDLDLRIPLELHGVTSLFHSCSPTLQELQLLPISHMTAPFPECNLHSSSFS